jgi:aminopeptidase
METKEIEKAIERLYSQNLGVSAGETVLIFTDKGKPGENLPSEALEKKRYLIELVQLIKGLSPSGAIVKEVIFETTGGHGKEPPEELWVAAFGPEVVEHLKREGMWSHILSKNLDSDHLPHVRELFLTYCREPVQVVIGLSYYSTTHTQFRKFLTELFKARYASMPLFDKRMFETAMTADWEKVAERSKKMADLLRGSEEILIEAPNGTNMRMGLRDVPIHEDSGILTKPGSYGNLPAGEVFLPPQEGTSDGKLALEWGPTWQLSEPITLYIEGGEVKKVSGVDPYTKELERFLEKDRNYRNVAELGIGTNDKARRPDNILESEKILGTIHVALGDNSSFGGTVSTPFHQDFVVFKPTVTIISQGGDKKQILTKGRLTDVLH